MSHSVCLHPLSPSTSRTLHFVKPKLRTHEAMTLHSSLPPALRNCWSFCFYEFVLCKIESCCICLFVWLILLSIMSSGFIHTACVRISFLFKGWISHCIYHVLCYHSSVKGYPFLAVVNNATVKHGCTNIWSPNSLVIHTELELLVHMVIYF